MTTENPKRKPSERITQPRFLTVLVGLILLVAIGIIFATTSNNPSTESIPLTETPDCGTRAGYQLLFTSRTLLYLTDESSGQPRAITNSSFPPRNVTWSPDSQRIAFTENDGAEIHIQVVSANGDAIGSLTFQRIASRGIVFHWLPDSQTIIMAVPVDGGTELLRWQVGDDDATRLVSDNATIITTTLLPFDESRRWALSPDGTQIAYIATQNGRDDVLLVDSESGDSRTVFEDALDDATVEWSHDGQYVLLTNRDLYRITASDGTVTQLTEAVSADNAHWSPDDSRVAYTHNGGLYVIPANGGEAQPLVENMVRWDFYWSPDGEWLLFILEGDVGVSVINADGSGFVNLLGSDHSAQSLGWSTDSQYILHLELVEPTADRPIYLTTLATGETIQVSPDSPQGAVWSPDGRYVAIEIDNRLHLVEAATGYRCIVHRNGSAYPYIWRPIPID